MTSSDATPSDPDAEVGLRDQLSRVEAELSELLREVHELRAELTDEGPMDSADRSAIMTQAEQLEEISRELERRRQGLVEKLGDSS